MIPEKAEEEKHMTQEMKEKERENETIELNEEELEEVAGGAKPFGLGWIDYTDIKHSKKPQE